MLTILAHITIAIGLLIGTFTDFKTREVPDWLNFSLIGIGLGLGLLQTIFSWSYQPLLYSIIGLILGIIIGYIMFYAGQWGGGDAKLIMGLGALFGINLFTGIKITELQPFLLFIINTILVGALYGLAWALIVGIKNFKELKKTLKEKLKEKKIIRLRIIVIAITVILIILAIITKDFFITFSLAILATIIFFTFYLWIITKAVETSCMVKTIPLKKLTEGDWIYKDIWLKNPYRNFKKHLEEETTKKEIEHLQYDDLLSFYKLLGTEKKIQERTIRIKKNIATKIIKQYEQAQQEIRKKTNFSLKKIINILEGNKITFQKEVPEEIKKYLKEQHNYDSEKKYVCGPKDLGISKEQIKILKEKKIMTIIIKEGIPFVPSFLLAYMVTMILGNWLTLLF